MGLQVLKASLTGEPSFPSLANSHELRMLHLHHHLVDHHGRPHSALRVIVTVGAWPAERRALCRLAPGGKRPSLLLTRACDLRNAAAPTLAACRRFRTTSG